MPDKLESIEEVIPKSARALCSVAPSLPVRSRLERELEAARAAAERGYFLADEDELVRGAFARYLGVRAALHETIRELEPMLTAAELQGTAPPGLRRCVLCGLHADALCQVSRRSHFVVEIDLAQTR